MPLDTARLAAGLSRRDRWKPAGNSAAPNSSAFARSAARRGGVTVTIACTQEVPLFSGHRRPRAKGAEPIFVNIRETAGWSTRRRKSRAENGRAARRWRPTRRRDCRYVNLNSEGVTLIYGRDEKALEVAALLKDHLDVTVLLTRPRDLAPPRLTEFPVVKGTIRSATRPSRRVRTGSRRLRDAVAVVARHAEVRLRRATARLRAAT